MSPLIRAAEFHQLLQNDHQQEKVRGTPREIDFLPVVLLHLNFTPFRWLLTELWNEDENTAFGLCDLGQGTPELGSVWLSELADLRHGHLRVIQDINFKTSKPLSWWTREASARSSLALVKEPAS